MAAIKNIKIEFIEDFSNNKKGDVREFSKDISNIFISDLKVAKLYEVKEVKKVNKK
jgi:hypothetical protein